MWLLLLQACAGDDPKPAPTPTDLDGDGVDAPADCDDADPDVHPGADERCDQVDDDCDGEVDEDPVDGLRFVVDADGDGFGDADAAAEVVACAAPTGFVPTASDCDDHDPDVSPAGTEVCDGVDDDCDGTIDLGAVDAGVFYDDNDGDGFGRIEVRACEAPPGAVPDDGDCDDADPERHPGADEVCDGVDQDCDGVADEDAVDAPLWYLDGDGDQHGDPAVSMAACAPPFAWVAVGDDCDDADLRLHPGAPELCNGRDEDCDGVVDEGAPGFDESYADLDGDGFGDAGAPTIGCGVPPGRVADATDCDDADPDRHPGAADLCDGVDQDCSGGEDGLVSVELGGVVTDATAAWSAGTASAPAAIAAPAGAIYRVCPGTFWVTVDEVGGVEIVGPYGRDATTLAGAAGARVLTSALSASLSGITVVGAAVGGSGGAVYAAGAFDAVDVVIASGSADQGGDLACAGCVATLTGSVVQDGVAALGGGIWVDGGSVTLVDTTVPRGLATDGAGVYLTNGASFALVRGEIASSSASGRGGGLYASASSVDLQGPLISGNDAPDGGGAWLGDGSTLAMGQGAIFYDNVGGGIVLEGSSGTCTGSGSLEGVFGNLGCGLVLGVGAAFDSIACDWLGSTDNAPADVCDAGGATFDYGDDATFAVP